jgi:hypothetical protein
MRWKIIVVNAGIVLVLGLLTYFLLRTSLTDVVANPAERKREVIQAVRAANAQLALDALKLERWLDDQSQTEAVRGAFSPATPQARSESATAQANRIRDAAVSEPGFAKLAPALVLFTDERGIAMGRNGSALMRGDNIAAAYPGLATALKSGRTGSEVWINRERQEQMLASYAPIENEAGGVIGVLIVGTPLNDERLARTSDLTSGQNLLLGVQGGGDKIEVIANSGRAAPGLVRMVGDPAVARTVGSALASSNVVTTEEAFESHVFGAAPLEGYANTSRLALIVAVPASLVSDLASLLWPVLGLTALGILLVIVAGWLLGNYFAGPIAEMEDGILSIINGNTGLRFQIEHPDLGGLVFRLNSLLNALMGVAEDNTDDQGRPSTAPAVTHFQDALAVDESSVSRQADPRAAGELAAEPSDKYYRRLYSEYISAKRQLGDPVDHITHEAFLARIQGSEREMSQKHGRPVRYQVQLKDGVVTLIAVPLPD